MTPTLRRTGVRCAAVKTAVAAAAGIALAGLVQATPSAARKLDPQRLHYERERAQCLAGHAAQPREVCLREAAAAYAEARRGRLARGSGDAAQWAANALKRCEAQPPEDRAVCEQRVRQGDVAGSVARGAQLTTLTVPTSPAAAPSAAASDATPPPR